MYAESQLACDYGGQLPTEPCFVLNVAGDVQLQVIQHHSATTPNKVDKIYHLSFTAAS